MAGVVLLAVTIGFGRTYTAPVLRGTFSAPWVVHVHGALAMTWVLLFLTQSLIVRDRRGLPWHRRLGQWGLPLAVAVAVTMLPAGVFAVTRDVAAGGGAATVSTILGVVTSAVMFVALVGAGIVARRRREAHARWMLLATLVVAWPAWFRFRHWFPAVPRPEIWFAVVAADVWIVIAMARDYVVRGAVHPVLAWAGTGIILEQSLEVWYFDSPSWRAASHFLYDLLS